MMNAEVQVSIGEIGERSGFIPQNPFPRIGESTHPQLNIPREGCKLRIVLEDFIHNNTQRGSDIPRPFRKLSCAAARVRLLQRMTDNYLRPTYIIAESGFRNKKKSKIL